MKARIIILLLTLVSYVLAEETFMEEIIGLVQPLAIMGIFLAPPVLIVAIIMAVAAAGKKGAELTSDLLKDDDEEDDE